ncbi:MAG TPA: class I SAM-dependent methyltransferase [Candidatus Obscuribacterales bacterium]
MSCEYRPDLSHIHHVGFGDYSLSAAPGLLKLLRQAKIIGAQVVDLGCGSGLWLHELCREAYDVVGIDASAAMLEIARRTAPDARLLHGSVLDVEIPPCDAVTAIGEVLCYITDGADGTSALAKVFKKVSEALPVTGLFIFDLLVSTAGKLMNYRTWRAGRDWAVLTQVTEDQDGGLLVRDITTFRRCGEHYRKDQESHVLRVYSRADVERELRRAGFSVRCSRSIGEFRLPPRRMAFVARKRE